MAGWVNRLTLSQRKLLFAVIAVGLIGLGLVSLRLPSPQRAAPPAVSTRSPLPSALAGPDRGAAPDGPVVVEGLNADQAKLALPDDELAVAQAVAEGFCAQYATRRWDESPDARLARLAPFMSDELVAAFASDAGGAALEDERRKLREVATAQPEFAYPQTVSRDEVVITVVVLQTVTTTEGMQERRPSFQVVLKPSEGAWRVVNVVA